MQPAVLRCARVAVLIYSLQRRRRRRPRPRRKHRSSKTRSSVFVCVRARRVLYAVRRSAGASVDLGATTCPLIFLPPPHGCGFCHVFHASTAFLLFLFHPKRWFSYPVNKRRVPPQTRRASRSEVFESLVAPRAVVLVVARFVERSKAARRERASRCTPTNHETVPFLAIRRPLELMDLSVFLQ